MTISDNCMVPCVKAQSNGVNTVGEARHAGKNASARTINYKKNGEMLLIDRVTVYPCIMITKEMINYDD